MIAGRIRVWWALISSRLRVAYYRFMGVTIGERCYISSRAQIDVAGKVIMGYRVRLSAGSFVLAHAAGRPKLKEGEATILEDRVIVFVNAVVLSGVTIGKNSIVAAGSVVVRDVPPDVIVAGNPARVVRHLDKEKK